MKRSAKPSAGFTLVELLVVMGIMGLILTAVLSAKPKTATTRVAVAARAVAAALRLARAQAMASNAETVVRIDFREWTSADHLRHTKFVALRDDRDPRKVVKE